MTEVGALDVVATHTYASNVPADLLSVTDVHFAYGPSRVLHGVSLALRVGEIHVLAGANGSGKSTLIKVLAGMRMPLTGSISAHDRTPFDYTTGGAAACGLRFVHQELGLVSDWSVLENVLLGNRYPRCVLGPIRWSVARQRVRRVLEELHAELPLDVPVAKLSEAQRASVALTRALYEAPKGSYLVLDETTAAMDAAQADRLFAALRRAVDVGQLGVLFVSHRLHEMFAYGDVITVLRDGRVVASSPLASLSPADLVDSLSGTDSAKNDVAQSASDSGPQPSDRPGPAVELIGVRGHVLRDLTLSVHRGEVVGVAGLEGSGKEEIVELIAGQRTPNAGTIRVDGADRVLTQRTSRKLRIGVVPSDRRQLGGIGELSVEDNLFLPRFSTLSHHGFISRRASRARARELLRKYRVVPDDPQRRFGTLSGGNQQKVVIARWLEADIDVLVLHEATAGVDVPSRRAILQLVREAAANGCAVLFVSSDEEELPLVCSTVAVLADGKLTALLQGDEVSREAIARASFPETT